MSTYPFDSFLSRPVKEAIEFKSTLRSRGILGEREELHLFTAGVPMSSLNSYAKVLKRKISTLERNFFSEGNGQQSVLNYFLHSGLPEDSLMKLSLERNNHGLLPRDGISPLINPTFDRSQEFKSILRSASYEKLFVDLVYRDADGAKTLREVSPLNINEKTFTASHRGGVRTYRYSGVRFMRQRNLWWPTPPPYTVVLSIERIGRGQELRWRVYHTFEEIK